MADMSRNNSAVALQGFSISQPFLGAALQFYPAMGTQQLDDLINAFLPGPASIKEKRATVSVDFFEYSQLTGETMKYYPVYTQSFGSTTASSVESSPNQDSGYGSNLVSPVISDWSCSQSTPSSASPFSVTQDSMFSKASKKAAASTVKSHTDDFSHLPGMKIMTKDGLDVTNSASRGCKTKEQRDHAHLMRIIKACDACRKKKVRCDPSHKKRAAAQSQPAASARSTKKAKTLPQTSRTATARSQQGKVSISTPSGFTEPSCAGFETSYMPLELSESWESFVQFDDEPANTVPFDYDFFSDPEGHLSPLSNQSPATPSMAFSKPRNGLNLPQNLFTSEQFHDDAIVRPPTLPYLDAAVPANNYVDFSLYSPEPSFLDEDSALVSDIVSGAGREQGTPPQRHGLVQDRQPLRSRELENHSSSAVSTDSLADYNGLLSVSQVMDDRRCLFSSGGQPSPAPQASVGCEGLLSSAGEQIVTQNNHSCRPPLPGLSSSLRLRSRHVLVGAQDSNPIQVQPLPAVSTNGVVGALIAVRARDPRDIFTASAIATGPTSQASPAQPLPSQLPLVEATSSSCLSALLESFSHAKTATATCGDGNHAVIRSDVNGTAVEDGLQITGVRSSESRGSVAPFRSRSSATDLFGLGGVQSTVATIACDVSVSALRSSVVQPSSWQVLLCMALLATACGMVIIALRPQAPIGSLFQIALGLALHKAFHNYSSLLGSRPQQSRLSSTPKPQGFSDGARLLSCVSTRLRQTCRQNHETHYQGCPAVGSMTWGFAQRFR